MVNLTSENPQALREGATLDFTYAVKWEPTDIRFARRFERYLDYNFFEHQIHWFSIFNSFMMVIFLTGLVRTGVVDCVGFIPELKLCAERIDYCKDSH